MKDQKLLRNATRTFFHNWGAYVSLLIVINLLLSIIVVPIMEFMTSVIFKIKWCTLHFIYECRLAAHAKTTCNPRTPAIINCHFCIGLLAICLYPLWD
jgi:hypothetical protein